MLCRCGWDRGSVCFLCLLDVLLAVSSWEGRVCWRLVEVAVPHHTPCTTTTTTPPGVAGRDSICLWRACFRALTLCSHPFLDSLHGVLACGHSSCPPLSYPFDSDAITCTTNHMHNQRFPPNPQFKRFTKNNFFIEKNPTLVTFPVKNLDLREALPVPTGRVSCAVCECGWVGSGDFSFCAVALSPQMLGNRSASYRLSGEVAGRGGSVVIRYSHQNCQFIRTQRTCTPSTSTHRPRRPACHQPL